MKTKKKEKLGNALSPWKTFLRRLTQWIIFPFKTYTWLGTFRYNCIRGQLNNEGGGELHEIKQSRDKTEICKEIIW